MSAVFKTLLISDLVGSTGLLEKLGDEKAFRLFSRHDRIARDLMTPNGGLEIDKTDGFLLLFEKPFDAVCYALTYHEALRQLSDEFDVDIKARVGIHFGEVYLRENPEEDVKKGAKPIEVEGLAKPAAARLMSVALPGQTLLMRGAFDLARRASVGRDVGELTWVAHGPYLFKGIDEPIDVFEVGIASISPLEAPEDSEKVKRVHDGNMLEGWRPARELFVPHRPNWTLTDKLGEGGFGEVWKAENRKTGDIRVYKFCFEKERIKSLQREVTLFRLIKTTLGNRDDIAKILDWNFDEPPFFLEVEYTEGGSLHDWAEQQGGIDCMPLEERLEIFVQVANALSAAHSVGILHKDIKPANILITPLRKQRKVQAKLTDFGIGLVTDSQKLEDAGITVFGFTELHMTDATSGVGTLQYMAPELFSGGVGTVKADIYALGVLLYQLVIGSFKAALAPGWQRNLDDPVLIGDISQATDGDTDLRLGDAGELARKIAHLEERRAKRRKEEEEKAQAEQAKMELQKSQRKKRLFSIAAFFLLAFSLIVTFQAKKIADSAERANLEADVANRVSGFLVDLFELPEGERGETVTGQDLLERGSRQLEGSLLDKPLLRARMLETMGNAYFNLGLFPDAEKKLNESYTLFNKLLGPQHVDTVRNQARLGYLVGRKGNYQQSQKLFEEAVSVLKRNTAENGVLLRQVLEEQMEILRRAGHFDQAQVLEDEAAQLPRAKEGRDALDRHASKGYRDVLELKQFRELPTRTMDVIPSMRYPGMAIARSAAGLYLLDLNKKRPPDFIPLDESERIVGSLQDGRMGIRKGSKLYFRDFMSGAETTDLTLFSDLEDHESVFFSTSGRTFCRKKGKSLNVYQREKGELREVRHVVVEKEPLQLIEVGDSYVAFVQKQQLSFFPVAEGNVTRVSLKIEGRIETLAMEENFKRLAVGGWFDEVYLLDLNTGDLMDHVQLKGRTASLFFIGDYPTLAIGKTGSLSFWRSQEGFLWKYERADAQFRIKRFGFDGFFVHEMTGQELYVYHYHGLKTNKRVQISAMPLWTSVSNEATGEIFFGGADGVLHKYNPDNGKIRSAEGHSQGVTTSALIGNLIATGSDDKTLAVWDPEKMEIIKRQKAHAFLVNFISYDQPAKLLWSSSSDHLIKAWNWPDLELKHQITLPEQANAGFWMDENAGHGFSGAWSRDFNFLEKKDGQWLVAKTEKLDSTCTYATLDMPSLEGVFALGLHPSQLLYYHKPSQTLHTYLLPEYTFTGITRMSDTEILLFGQSSVLLFEFFLEGNRLSFEGKHGLNTRLRNLGCGSSLEKRGLIAAGNEQGFIYLIDKSEFPNVAALQSHWSWNGSLR
ncbi:MAG: hypothetical protein CSA81_10465 [Acidobacteria bacterium]|nr:MAG: hypothetical protein CSA81_10465 [Acidobacteriota bacterium]